MNNLEVEIYINQLINFFEKNPNDLMDLIGEGDREKFYSLVKSQCLENFQKGDDVSLTQDQLIEIIINLKKKKLNNKETAILINKVFESTKFGLIGLN